MHKVLFTSVIRPFGGPGEGDSVGAELFHAQVTRAQGAFSPRQVIRCWAIDYLAHNISAPAVTLHYPSKAELVRELKRGGYTHVGINFVVATFHKVLEMVALVREHAPRAKIVLGGYGTVLPDRVLAPHADAICREEGIGFMRRLLNERVDAPIEAPHAPIPAASVLGVQQRNVVGHVTAGLGCPNGCDFCCTSHFFNRAYVRLLPTGRDVYEALMRSRRAAEAEGLTMSSYIVIDEDFFLHHERARQFLEAAREGGEPLSIMGFGSVRGLSRFTSREIAEMGFDLVWNAFEGKQAGYRKQEGKPLAELYRDLKRVGCAQLTSMIIGFPYQDEATIRAEFEELLALEPALVQCLIYFAFPGTPFHAQVVKEARYTDELRSAPDLRRWDGFSMHFKHPKFARPEQVEALQRELYRQDFQRLGPSVVRLARVWLDASQHLANDASQLLRKRAARLRENARASLPVLKTAARVAVSARLSDEILELRGDILRLTGDLTPAERVLEEAATPLYLATEALGRLGLMQQPGLLRTEHRLPGAAQSQRSAEVFKLQGREARGVPRTFASDALRLALGRGGRKAEVDAHEITGVARGMPPSLRLVT